MKLKIIFLKKKYIISILIAILIILLLIIFVRPKKTSEVINIISDRQTLKQDLTGDEVDDLIYIKTNKDNKYDLNITSKGKNFIVKPEKKSNSLGQYYNYWPMRITFCDITRDNIPEILIQSSENNTPLQHIFTYQNNNFKDIFCSNSGILGVVDSKNSKTPKIITGDKSNNKINFASHIFIKDKIVDYSSNYDENFAGKNTVFSFINYIQTLPYGEENKPTDIFGSTISGKDMAVIGNISLDKYILKFQDAFFTDTKWNSDSEISELKWILNFKGTSINDAKISKNYSITLILNKIKNPSDKYQYRIASIQS